MIDVFGYVKTLSEAVPHAGTLQNIPNTPGAPDILQGLLSIFKGFVLAMWSIVNYLAGASHVTLSSQLALGMELVIFVASLFLLFEIGKKIIKYGGIVIVLFGIVAFFITH